MLKKIWWQEYHDRDTCPRSQNPPRRRRGGFSSGSWYLYFSGSFLKFNDVMIEEATTQMREDQTHIDHGIIMEDPERSSRTTYGLTDTPNRIIFPVRNATNMPPRINPNTSTQAPKKVKIAATTNRTMIGVSSISSSTVVCRSN